jgi:hypothetical protein
MHCRRKSQEEPEDDHQQPGEDPELQEEERVPQEDVAQKQDKWEHIVAAGDGERMAATTGVKLSAFYVKLTRAISQKRRLQWKLLIYPESVLTRCPGWSPHRAE